jgi:ferric-dicitrate binding protein FerR (iron transport regulator)
MSDIRKELAASADDAVEVLLQQAAPRLSPPIVDERLVREAVRAEWQAVTGRRNVRRRIGHFAIAATVLLALAATFNTFRVVGVVPQPVATISKSHGSIYLLGEQSELHQLPDLASISVGETIVTGGDAGVGLEWHGGGSLRIDANTRVEFQSPNSVYLQSGRIYFDSQTTQLIAGTADNLRAPFHTASGSPHSDPALEFETVHGTVTHLGTRYMTYSDEDTLSVSVRDGEVVVDGPYFDGTAVAGQQLTISGTGRPALANVASYGGAWEWIEAIAPAAQLDGKTVHEFLRWVSYETGLELSFESSLAEQVADRELLRGTVETGPMNALRVWMMGVDLDWRVDVIDSDSGR